MTNNPKPYGYGLRSPQNPEPGFTNLPCAMRKGLRPAGEIAIVRVFL